MKLVHVATSRLTAWLSFALSLAGLGISTYLTIAHYVGTRILACSDKGVVNCSVVTTSAQSHFLGMPVSVLGLSFFIGMVVLTLPWSVIQDSWWAAAARAAGLATGLLFVLWLIAAELLIIDHICLWCTGVHVVTFLLAVVQSRELPAQLRGA